MEPKSVQSYIINNVFFCFNNRRKNKQRRRFAYTQTGNIQLIMQKTWKFEIGLTDFQRIS